MPREVQRGGEAEPDGPRDKHKDARMFPSSAAEEPRADRDESAVPHPSPDKTESKEPPNQR